MITKPEPYPALYVIFTLLNAIRHGIEKRNIWREFRRQKIALKPRLIFWIAICKRAGLLHEYDGKLRVSSYARTWLNKTPEEQTIQLIEAWENAPKNKKSQLFRKKLIWKLKFDKPLTQKDIGAFHGLEALGILHNQKLTALGRTLIKGEGQIPAPKPVSPCFIKNNHFVAPLHGHLDLLWQLEQYLRSDMPGSYPLTKRALQFFGADPYTIIDLIEQGLQSEIPEQTKASLLSQPSIRIAEGVVLEFSTPAELAQLRRQPGFREYIDEFLSSQRVLVSSKKAETLFRMLKRRGVYVHQNEEQPKASPKRTHFPQKTILEPVGRNVSKTVLLEKYKQLGQALDVLYRAPGYPAEQRRITPLAIERRGEHTFVIAFCQTRRAQRTFRLDRMEIPGTW